MSFFTTQGVAGRRMVSGVFCALIFCTSASFAASRCESSLASLSSPLTLLHSESPGIELMAEAFLPTALRQGIDQIRQRGPFNQPMALRYGGGLPTIYGTHKAVQRARPEAGELREKIFDLTLPGGRDTLVSGQGDQSVSVKLAPAVAGSAVVTRRVGDLDAELMMVSSFRGFRMSDFSNPASPLIRSVESTLRQTIASNLRKGYIFADFKAGEYDFVPASAQSTKSRAIKWSLSDLERGFQWVPQGHAQGPVKKLTLREALASQSRIKVDWLARVKTDSEFRRQTGLEYRYQEHSVLITLAGQRPGGTAILRVSDSTRFPELGATGGFLAVEGRAGEIPLRATTLYFDPFHVELARQASVTASGPDLRHFNTVTINTVKTHLEHRRYFKLVRMLFTRLHYWNDLQAFTAESQRAAGRELHPQQLIETLREIQLHGEIRTLYVFSEAGKALAEVLSRRPEDPALRREVEEFLQAARQFSQLENSSQLRHLQDANRYFIWQMNQLTLELIHRSPSLRAYLEFVTSSPYAQRFETYEATPSFLSFAIPSSFQNAYRQLLRRWQERYPEIQFSLPRDLHMTLTFFGQVPTGRKAELRQLVRDFEARVNQQPLELTEGSLQLIGRNNSQVAIVFDVRQLPSEVVTALAEFKVAVHRLLGSRPEERSAQEFLPHISVAHVRDLIGQGDQARQISRLLLENLGGVENIRLSGETRLLEVLPTPAETNPTPRYRLWDGQ